MAFPSIRSVVQNDGDVTTSPTSTMPATISSGDLVLIFLTTDGNGTVTPDAAVDVELLSDYSYGDFTTNVFAFVADGTEDSTTLTHTNTASEAFNSVTYAIQDWFGTIATGVDIDQDFSVFGSGSGPIPPSLTASWGSDDNLWFAYGAGDIAASTPSAGPSGYTFTAYPHSGSPTNGRQGVGLAYNDVAAATENPGGFTQGAATGGEQAVTVAIRPAAAGDTTAPVLTSPTAGSLTTDGVTPSVTTNEGNGTLYWGIYADAASPTAAQVVAGTSAILSGSQAVSGTGSQAVSAQTGLDDATSYELFFVHDDAAANRSNLSTVGFTTSTDSTEPSLTSPTAGSLTSTSVSPTVTTDTAEGTAYARVYSDGATPTASQVQSGTGVTPVASATNITVGASGALNFSAITGLTEGTAYELYFVHEDDATTPNLSAVSTVGFTSTAAARSVELTAANGYELRDETGTIVASLNGIVWEWYDDPDSTAGSPTDSGTFNTDAGGEATITITGSSLADGAFGTLWVRHPTDDEIRGNYYLPITVS